MTAEIAKLAISMMLNATTTAVAPAAENQTLGSRPLPYSPPVMALLGLLASIASFVTVVGNLLVVTAFFVERQLRSATNYFIASLAITDLMIGMFSMNLYTLYLLLGEWPLGRIVCDLWLSLDYTACLTSQYTVFCITVDRFCSVKIPAKYRKWRTERKVQVMVAATWLLPAMLFVPPIFAWPHIANSQRNDTECYAEFSEDPVYNTVLTICYFWVTLAVMIGLYIGIYRVALQLARKSEAKRQKVNNLITLSSTGGGGGGGGGSGRAGGGGGDGGGGRSAAGTMSVSAGTCSGGGGVGHAGAGGDPDDGSPHDPLMPSNRKATPPGRKDAANMGVGGSGFAGDRKMSKRERRKLYQQQQQLLQQQRKRQRGNAGGRGLNSSGDEDRSSSPVLPSDSDTGHDAAHASNHQQKHQNQKKHHYRKQRQVKTGKIAGSAPLAAINSPVLVETPPPPLPPPPPPPQLIEEHQEQQLEQQQPHQQQRRAMTMNASSDSDYHTASGLSYENPALDVNGSLAVVHFAVPLHQMCPDRQDEQAQQQQKQPPPPYSLCAPSDRFEGLRYIDEDSIRSNPSIDSMRLLVELLPKRWWRQQSNSQQTASKDGAGGSPVWKRRTSFQPSSECRENSESTKQKETTKAVVTAVASDDEDCIADRIVTSVVELPASSNSCELTVLEQPGTSAPTAGSGRPAVVCHVTRYLRDATRRLRRQVGSRIAGSRKQILKEAKKQSRTENRARKALKTISLILGAFVACWTPYHVFILIRSMCKGDCLNDHLYNLGYWLCYMNSPINPFCYALANAQFKKTFLRIIRLDLRRR